MFSNHDWAYIIFASGGVVFVVAWLKQTLQKTIERIDAMAIQLPEIKVGMTAMRKSLANLEKSQEHIQQTVTSLIKSVQKHDSDIEWMKKNMEQNK